MNETGIGEVRTKLLETDHKQWNCGMGVFDPNVVYTLEDPNGYVVVDGKLSKIVTKSDYEKVYKKIGDKYYKTVKIGNLLWMCENLDYKWDGLEIGNIYAGQGAAYREDDEATWGWNGRKAGLYYNLGSIAAMAGDDYVDPPIPSILPDGWRLPTNAEYAALREYVKDENNVERVDKLFVPECSWSPYEHPADAKMNETGLSLIPAGYYINGGDDEGWSDLDNEHCSTIVISDGDGSYGNTYFVYAPTSSTYGLFENSVADFPAPVRLVKDV